MVYVACSVQFIASIRCMAHACNTDIRIRPVCVRARRQHPNRQGGAVWRGSVYCGAIRRLRISRQSHAFTIRHSMNGSKSAQQVRACWHARGMGTAAEAGKACEQVARRARKVCAW